MLRKREASPSSSSEDSEDSLSSSSNSDSDDSSSNESEGLINCDFEFFDPQKQDFLGIKHLLRQLFDTDADSLNIDALTELVLAQPLVGSTVKTEGHEADPLSFLTVLNLRVHKENPVIQALVKYLLEKVKGNDALKNVLESKEGDVGLVLSERIINMPPAVAAPSYKMLLEELHWANEDNEPYEFSHYLIVSRTYLQSASDSDMDEEVSVKPRAKKQKRQASVERQYFHPEDELFSANAEIMSYSFGGKDSSEDQNLKTSGLLLLLPKLEFESSIARMEDFLAGEE